MKQLKSIYSVFSFLLLFWISLSSLQAVDLSPKAQISLITGSPGQDLYTLFGHTAIRIYDPTTRMDYVYNYGTFDFETPGFLMKFVQRRLDYFLSIGYYDRFRAFYTQEGRNVYEQVLNLTQEEKQAVFNFLQENYKKENKFYRYDFFFDNCSTRPRDVLLRVLKGKIKLNKPTANTKTFRDLLDPYLHEPWIRLGLYILLGSPTDKVATYRQKMFLPEHLMDALDVMTIEQDGKTVLLVAQKTRPIQGMVSRTPQSFFTPTFLFWSLFLITGLFSTLGWIKNKHWYGIDVVIFGLMGLTGYLLLFMWFATDHGVLKYNFNLLWAFPLHFPVVFLLLFKKKAKFLPVYFLITGGLLVINLTGWFWLPQRFHPAVFPLILTLVLRHIKVYERLRKAS